MPEVVATQTWCLSTQGPGFTSVQEDGPRHTLQEALSTISSRL